MDKNIFIGKVTSIAANNVVKKEFKPRVNASTKKEYPKTSDVVQYKEANDLFYIVRELEGVKVPYELIWVLNAVHAKKLYSHPRNNQWPVWTEINWPELTTVPDRLEIIFKQWSPFKPGSVVDVVIDNGFAQVVKVHEP